MKPFLVEHPDGKKVTVWDGTPEGKEINAISVIAKTYKSAVAMTKQTTSKDTS